ncbi:GntR family transcriptional regulator, partial [Streptomyces sp. SID8455]|nr:GntR family transcriptional regulator [Streptomyces sp. SID8455]
MTFAPAPIPSRTQYVLEAIKHAILTAQLRPGQALV